MSRVTKDIPTALNAWFDDALNELNKDLSGSSNWTSDADDVPAAPNWLPMKANIDIHATTALIRICAALQYDRNASAKLFFDPFQFTVIETGDADWIEPVSDALENGLLRAMRMACQHLHKLTVLTPVAGRYPRDPWKQRTEFEKSLTECLAASRPVVCVLERLAELPEDLRSAVKQVVRLADLTEYTVLKLHHVLHGKSSHHDLRAALRCLPPASKMGCLSLRQLAISARHQKVQAMAESIAEICEKNAITVNSNALDCVKGLEGHRSRLEQLARDMQLWAKGELSWREVPQGVLVHGSAGTGKTFLAGKLAEQSGAKFISTSYSDWQRHGHLGDFLAAMHRSFEQARKNAPAVLFIDEIDSFDDRASASGENANYTRAAVNGLLEMMDGAQKNEGVLIVGACNFPEKLDQALVRSGRFDLKIEMRLPGKDTLAEILADHCGPSASRKAISDVAAQLIGGCGADAAAVVRQAGSLARRQGRPILDEDLLHAAQQFAPATSRGDLQRAAIHEAGHVVVGAALDLGIPERAELRSRGGSVSFNLNSLYPVREEVDANLATFMAGREAEMVLLGSASAGMGGDHNSDLAQATLLATRMEVQLGLGEQELLWRPVTSSNLDLLLRDPDLKKQVAGHLEAARIRARAVVIRKCRRVEAIAALLLEKREISKAEIELELSQNDDDVKPGSGVTPSVLTGKPRLLH